MYFTGFFGKTPGGLSASGGDSMEQACGRRRKRGKKSGPVAAWAGPSCAVRVLGLGGGVRAIHVEKNPQDLMSCGFSLRNDRENNTIRGFRFLVELSFGIWCSWVQSGCKTRRIWCTHSFRFAVISERTMARGRKKKFSDYIRTEVARIYRLLHNVGTLRRVPIFHFGCIFIGLTFLCP